jgi:hypothetical protein
MCGEGGGRRGREWIIDSSGLGGGAWRLGLRMFGEVCEGGLGERRGRDGRQK